MAHASQLLDLLRTGPVLAGQVLERLGCSRPTLSRLARSSPAVVRIGRARATRYALTREVRALGSRWPVFRIGPTGRPSQLGTLHALEPRAFWFETPDRLPWMVGDFADGLFPDLPWFLEDLRPQGFLGRAFARRHAPSLGLSPDPRLWSAAGVLVTLLLFGDDLPGDLVVGEEALARAQLSRPAATVSRADCATRYSELAATALLGETAGSSAAGEQQKFTATLEDQGRLLHVLVKFSPRLDTPGGVRWADLLVAEHLAEALLTLRGHPSSETRIVDGTDRRFLEVVRFDREGASGRRGFVSLFALDAAHYGKLDTWAAAADRLERDGWLAPDEARRLRLLWWFGRLIGNADMHFGNVSLTLDRPCRLAPTYDMLPMLYRPEPGGELVARALEPALPPPAHLEVWQEAAGLAVQLWEEVAQDARVSAPFREEAGRNATRVRSALARA